MQTGTVRRAILWGARDLRMEEAELPGPLAADNVYVETEITALSTGTDLGNYEGRSAEVPGAPGYPRGVGYSNVGVVRDVGSAVRSLAPGQRIFSTRPHVSAFIAPYTEVMVPVPEGVASEQASLAYLTQLGVIGLCTVGVARTMGARVSALTNSEIRAAAARAVGAQSVVLSSIPSVAEVADVV